jgi:hypothetical protein
LEESAKDMVEQYHFFNALKLVSVVGWTDLFQWSWWWREGMLQVLGDGKAYQQEPLCLKDKSVLPGINCLKNTLWLCIVEMHLKITNLNL